MKKALRVTNVWGEVSGNAYKLEYEYDAAGNKTLTRTVVTDSANNVTVRELENEYNDLNQLVQVRQKLPTVVLLASYSYDPNGNRKEVWRYGGGSAFVKTGYTFDAQNRLEKLVHRLANDAVVFSFEYNLRPDTTCIS